MLHLAKATRLEYSLLQHRREVRSQSCWLRTPDAEEMHHKHLKYA